MPRLAYQIAVLQRVSGGRMWGVVTAGLVVCSVVNVFVGVFVLEVEVWSVVNVW